MFDPRILQLKKFINMKNTFLLLLGLICGIQSIYAQDEDTQYPQKGDKEFSIHIGFNTSDVSVDNDFNLDTEQLTGLYAGARVDLYWSNRWSFMTGLYYDQRGYESPGFGGPVELRTNYLYVPVNINWHFGKNRRWNLNFGPSFSLLLSADNNGEDVKDDFASTDIGFDLGIGHKIPVGNNYIQLSLNGNGGITDISDGNAFTDIRNSRSNFAIGFIF